MLFPDALAFDGAARALGGGGRRARRDMGATGDRLPRPTAARLRAGRRHRGARHPTKSGGPGWAARRWRGRRRAGAREPVAVAAA
ncbi:Hypothetical protein MexAM1_META1p2667 [Methylorubrum extorquens AM1]|uniref:Uncharacterized protein n=1 Tax=Methylorubrum extorquens (strain ATCC 14718 / DSM 1338 / JCM 2805 / NCIMB 9133 / AM1) TaxID=272630 RepID=C5ASJ5_METEA|nr:Hypothetical protein MexAM1_META1p2667 [Methylorubrum extorquens AM1]